MKGEAQAQLVAVERLIDLNIIIFQKNNGRKVSRFCYKTINSTNIPTTYNRHGIVLRCDHRIVWDLT